MTTKLPPGSPPLEIDGKPESEAGDIISDSAWEGLPDTEAQKQAALGRIAKKRQKAAGGPARTEG